jgi:hypothetical protein
VGDVVALSSFSERRRSRETRQMRAAYAEALD